MVPADAGSPLLEREAQLSLLENAIGAGGSDQGAFVIIEAGAGLGKTALLGEATRMADVRGAEVLKASGSPLEASMWFGLIRHLLEPVVHAAARPRQRSL